MLTAGKIKKEYITIVREPSSSYIDHLTPGNGTSPYIANKVLYLIFETASSSSLNALSCRAAEGLQAARDKPFLAPL